MEISEERLKEIEIMETGEDKGVGSSEFVISTVADNENWQLIETVKKEAGEILVCNMRQGGVMGLVSWNPIHGYWTIKGVVDIGFQWTHWRYLPSLPK